MNSALQYGWMWHQPLLRKAGITQQQLKLCATDLIADQELIAINKS